MYIYNTGLHLNYAWIYLVLTSLDKNDKIGSVLFSPSLWAPILCKADWRWVECGAHWTLRWYHNRDARTPRMQHTERPCSDMKRGEKAPGLLEMVVGADSGLSKLTWVTELLQSSDMMQLNAVECHKCHNWQDDWQGVIICLLMIIILRITIAHGFHLSHALFQFGHGSLHPEAQKNF